MHTVVDYGKNIEPALVGHEIPEEPTARPRKEPLIGNLEFVKVDGLGAVTPMDMAEHMQARLDAPDLPEEMGIA